MTQPSTDKLAWACFLHIYQPANQTEEIFRRVADESYRPLVQGLVDHPHIKLTLNLSGALTEQLQSFGYDDVLSGLRLASERGQIEFTESAKFHTLLPFLPDEEISRQVHYNRETNRRLLGPSYAPKGFFPPEMAFSPRLVPLLESLGYEWVIADEIAYNGRVNQVEPNRTYLALGSRLKVFFRERNASNMIMAGMVRSGTDFRRVMGSEMKKDRYLVTGMDGETFGHHRPGLTPVLLDLLESPDLRHVFVGELPALFPQTTTFTPISSTWASTQKDIDQGIQFQSWKDPENPVHTYQWALQDLALRAVNMNRSNDSQWLVARDKLDRALASDHFFWASAKPWWSTEVIEAGAWALYDTVVSVPGISPVTKRKAKDLYYRIISKTFELQRSGYIRQLYQKYRETPRVPFKDRTIGVGKPWEYDAFITFMKREMKTAAGKENYEEAIFWRDAIWKLETKNDIYDSVHAVDVLRRKVTDPEVNELMEKYRKEYEKVVSGQPESRGV